MPNRFLRPVVAGCVALVAAVGCLAVPAADDAPPRPDVFTLPPLSDDLLLVARIAPPEAFGPRLAEFVQAAIAGTAAEHRVGPDAGQLPVDPAVLLGQPLHALLSVGPARFVVGNADLPSAPPAALMIPLPDGDAGRDARDELARHGLFIRPAEANRVHPVRVVWDTRTRGHRALLAAALGHVGIVLDDPEVPAENVEPGHDDQGKAQFALVHGEGGQAFLSRNTPSSRAFLLQLRTHRFLRDAPVDALGPNQLLHVDVNASAWFTRNEFWTLMAKQALPGLWEAQVVQPLEERIGELEKIPDAAPADAPPPDVDVDGNEIPADLPRRPRTDLLPAVRQGLRLARGATPLVASHGPELVDLGTALGRMQCAVALDGDALKTEWRHTPTAGSALARSLPVRPKNAPAAPDLTRYLPENVCLYQSGGLYFLPPEGNHPLSSLHVRLVGELGRLVDPEGDLGDRAVQWLRDAMAHTYGRPYAQGLRLSFNANEFANNMQVRLTQEQTFLIESPRPAETAALVPAALRWWVDAVNRLSTEGRWGLRAVYEEKEDAPVVDGIATRTARVSYALADNAPLQALLELNRDDTQMTLNQVEFNVSWAAGARHVALGTAESVARLLDAATRDRPALGERLGYRARGPLDAGQAEPDTLTGLFPIDYVKPMALPFMHIFGQGAMARRIEPMIPPGVYPWLVTGTAMEGGYRVDSVLRAGAASEFFNAVALGRRLATEAAREREAARRREAGETEEPPPVEEF